MSRYSGKCDLYDHMKEYMSSEEELEKYLAKCHFILKKQPLKIGTGKELALYYPYIIASGGFSRDDDNWLNLTSTDYIRETEKDRIRLYADLVQRALKKRKKTPYKNAKEVYEDVFTDLYGEEDKEQIMEIIKRCMEEKNPRLSDLRLPSCEYNRKVWYNELINLGYKKKDARAWVWHEPKEMSR